MFKSTTLLAAAVAIAASTVAAPAADAALVGVDSCYATASGTTHGDCVFLASGGFYKLYLYSYGEYSWAEVRCTAGGGSARVSGYSTGWNTFYTNADTCTLHVESHWYANAEVVKA